jgi:hypothetical protein
MVIGALAAELATGATVGAVLPDRSTTMITSRRQPTRAMLAIRTIGLLDSGGGDNDFIMATRCA